jgi:hypothetical protein
MALIGGLLVANASCENGSAVALPSGGGVLVAATVYSGSGPGAYGAGLAGHYAFAELGLWSEGDVDRSHADRIGRALGLGGALAPYTQIEVQAPNGRIVIAEKRDVGMGGAPVDGHRRAIDLWTSTRQALGLTPDWSGLVRVRVPADGVLTTEAPALAQAVRPPPDLPGIECQPGSVPASELGERVVQIARTQLGVREHPAGSNCTRYGPCEPWCALFATWVWRRAGVAIPSLAFSGTVYAWALRHSHAYSASTRPRPGWVALFGSGPADPSTSLHVGIVESVLPDGEMTLINGNFADSVVRTGPCRAASARAAGAGGCEEPGPIYGYAAPE